MKRIHLTETELTRLIQRVVKEQDVNPLDKPKVSEDDIMGMIDKWCKNTAPGSGVEGANCLENEPKDILFAIRDYCDGGPRPATTEYQ